MGRYWRFPLSAIAVLCALVTGCPPAEAAEAEDLTTLSLKQLMALDVISINVLGTHIHPAGQWMIGYEYMFDKMQGNANGTHGVSNSSVLDTFDVAPTDMTMQMHMVMVMYAPTNDLTLKVMLPYIVKSMNHVRRDGTQFERNSEGLGDAEVHALYTLFSTDDLRHRIILNAGVRLPTGSIDQSVGGNRLEYPMQLGSGTFDLMPGLAYLGQGKRLAWGAEFIPILRVGQNDNGYRLGNVYSLNGWGALKLTERLSLTGQANAQYWSNIHGQDPTLDPTQEPTRDVSLQGGRRVDLLLGLNAYFPTGATTGFRLAVDVGAPVYQWLYGPQLQTTFLLRAGLQWTF
jgi:hypothetical protein